MTEHKKVHERVSLYVPRIVYEVIDIEYEGNDLWPS